MLIVYIISKKDFDLDVNNSLQYGTYMIHAWLFLSMIAAFWANYSPS